MTHSRSSRKVSATQPEYELGAISSTFLEAIGTPPARPPGCVHLMLACLSLFKQYCAHDLYLHRDTHLQIYKLTMAFLTTPHEPKDILRFQADLEKCRCRGALNVHALHRYAQEKVFPGEQPPDFHDLVTMMATIVNSAIPRGPISLYKVDRAIRRAGRAGITPLFPSSPKELLPTGIETGIRSLIHVFMSDQTGLCLFSGLPLLAAVLRVCRGAGAPLLASTASFAFLIAHSGAGSLKLVHEDEPELRAAFLLSIARTFQYGFESMDDLELRHFCCNKPAASAYDVADRLNIICTSIPRVAAALPAAHAKVLRDTLEEFLQIGGRVHMVMSLPKDAKRFHPRILAISEAQAIERTDPFYVARRACKYFFESQRCGSTSCMKTYSSECRKFRRCSRCVVVPYCSELCQTESWANSKTPHRRICAYLRHFAFAQQVDSERSTRDDKSWKKAAAIVQLYMKNFQFFKYKTMGTSHHYLHLCLS